MKIVTFGLRTVDELAQTDPAHLTAIKGIGKKSATDFHTRARAIVQGHHIRTGSVAFPTVGTEIFLDLEGTGAQQATDELVEMDYLIGVLVRQAGREEYKAFVAHAPDKEGAMFHEFVDWLALQDDCQIYHWHHYEATHIRKLAERHGVRPEMHARLFGRMRDLYKDATSTFAFPTPNHSIKSIAPYVGFQWRHKDVSAMESIVLYFDYVKNPSANAAKVQKVLDYNEDDCVAMWVVKDWLVANGTNSNS